MLIGSRLSPAGRLFALTVLVLVVGLAKSAVSAPCDGVGAWISVGSLAPAAIACAVLLFEAVKQRTAGAAIIFIAGLLATGMAFVLAFGWTQLLCRGV